jgi:hypothetical protein
MESHRERAMRYRHYAEELRVVATGWQHVETIGKLNILAEDYDHMADALEQERGMLLPAAE